MSKNILITGGSGLLGKHLSLLAIKKGYQVKWLSRQIDITPPHPSIQLYKWNINKHWIDTQALRDTHIIINLAGAGIADKKWTDAYKKEILHSRIASSQLLIKYIQNYCNNLDVFIGGSAIGYYGMNIDTKVYTEEDPPATDFLGYVCSKWENTYQPLYSTNIRVCIIRTGLVLAREGGIYARLSTPFKYGLGTTIGNGKQNMPWIHILDWCRIVFFLIEHSHLNGAYNLVEGSALTNKEFSQALAQSFGKKILPISIPEWALKIVLGEGSRMLTTGLIISSEKIKKAGYQFVFTHIQDAFEHLKNN